MMRVVFILFVVVIGLSGCGIKPSSVDAPNGGDVRYPSTYPKLDKAGK